MAAIDFGTTQSGFAFSTRAKPENVVVNKNGGQEYGHASYKCPTTVLTSPQGEFVSFGYKAENDYCIKLEEGREDYLLYRHFKMMLAQQKITRTSTISFTTGKPRAAMEIFTMAIKHLKNEILDLLKKQQIITMNQSLIKWVITVPAIWRDEAKQFMREASFQAGLITHPDSKQLLIALEPEAASMYCKGRELKLYHKSQEEDTEVHFKTGDRYLIIDAGGGTVDITCHEVQNHGKVKDIHPASGGAWGSIYVDQEFEKLLQKVLGKDFMDNYQKECPNDWFALMLAFERAKASFNHEANHDINIQIIWSLGDKYEETYNKEIDVGIKEKRSLGVDFDNGALVIKPSTMANFLMPVISKTIDHVKNILRKPLNISYILLVGGFGQCHLLQAEIKKEFGSDNSILIPIEGQVAIMKGAVAFGHNPTNINTHISRLTYGCEMMKPFDEKIHRVHQSSMADSTTKNDLHADIYLIMAAIDFGTTQSGFAFSTMAKPDDIVMNKNWGQEYGHSSYKCPTTVLTSPQGEFVSFGYKAENDYCIKLEEGREDYLLYRHFKMMLAQQKITRTSTIKSTTGKPRAAMEIFTMAIKHLKNEILDLLKKQQIITMDQSLIKWVITVPAIWRDEAKRFMREASFQAGLITDPDAKQLLIALEPEAASMYCTGMELKLYHKGQEEDTEVHFKTGDRYLIIDAGGGTVDITCHEVQNHGKVKEIHPASGGAWGSIYVDQEFEKLLQKVFGKEFLDNYQKECPNDWFSLMLAFERVKASFNHEANHDINIQIIWSLGDKYEETYDKEIDVGIKEKCSLGVDFDNGALVIKPSTMANLLMPVISKTIDHVRNILRKPLNVTYILLVGGFGQCHLLQAEIKKEFGSDNSILIPMEGQLAIMKGAVTFGHNPTNIKTRISKLTYGYGIMETFDEKIHRSDYLTMDDGKKMCINIFSLAIQSGQQVETDFRFKFDLEASEEGRKKGCSRVSIYSTPKMEVMYTTDDQVQKLAALTIEHNHQKEKAPIEVCFVVGGTELLVEVQDKETKEQVHTTVDFLSDEK